MFLRIFLFCGIGFGALQAAVTLMRDGSAGRAIGWGVGSGLFFGLVMGFVLTAVHRIQMKRKGMDPDAPGSMVVDVRESLTVPLPPDHAITLCRSAVEQLRGVRAVGVDAATLRARVGMSWASAGESIECRVQPVADGSSVEIRSRPLLRTTMVDYGKNRENVQHIRAFLSGAGASAHPSG